jgi:hypothetical protein
MSTFVKELVFLSVGGFGGWLGSVLLFKGTPTAQAMGFIAGAAFVRGVEYEIQTKIERDASQGRINDTAGTVGSCIAAVGSLSLGVAAACVAHN